MYQSPHAAADSGAGLGGGGGGQTAAFKPEEI